MKNSVLRTPFGLTLAVVVLTGCAWWDGLWQAESASARIVSSIEENPAEFTYHPPLIKDDILPNVSRLLNNMNIAGEPDEWERTRRELVFMGPDVVPHILFFLDQAYLWDTPLEKQLVLIVSQIGYGAVPNVKKCLRAENRQTRRNAVKILMAIGDTRVINDLCELWEKDRSKTVRLLLAEAFVKMPNRRSMLLLIGCLDDENVEIRHAARTALQLIRGRDFQYDKQMWLNDIGHVAD